MLQEKYIFTVNILHFRTWRMSVSLSMEMLAVQKVEMLQDTNNTISNAAAEEDNLKYTIILL